MPIMSRKSGNEPLSSLKSNEPITFFINKKQYHVTDEYSKDMLLVDFLRDEAVLTGTKFMCRRGGCGACIVTIKKYDPITEEVKAISANACLIPIYSCAGLDITTVEGLGNSRKGYDPIQKKLVEYYGTQCGYCSPGMVMTMNSLMEQHVKNGTIPSLQEIEDTFDGNICRCTGFRPILDAMKTFGSPNIKDIEDIKKRMTCPKTGESCGKPCKFLASQKLQAPICTKLQDSSWYRPTDLKKLYAILKDLKGNRVRLVVGNTRIGLFKGETYPFYIDVNGVHELNKFQKTAPITIGANITLTELINFFSANKQLSTIKDAHGEVIANALKTVGNTAVRNLACWAGNLIMKRDNPGFQSDIFTLLEAMSVKLKLGYIEGKEKTVLPSELLTLPKEGWVIKSMELPKLTDQHYLDFHKVKQRNQNCHAYVNAAFLLELDPKDNFKVLSKPSLVFGGVAPSFTHATKTEELLVGKQLGDEATLQMALDSLSKEIEPNVNPVLSSPEFRRQLLTTLFYKSVLKILKESVDKRFVSGGENISRPITTSAQDFPTNEKNWPLTKPIPKIESKAQCSGELKYTTDLPRPKDTLYGVFVLSTVANAKVKDINADEALKMPGVVQFLTSKDIPGQNNIYTKSPWIPDDQELFSNGKVSFAGEPLGLIIAETEEKAYAAAKKVKVEYMDVEKPILTIEDSIKNGKATVLTPIIKKEGDVEKGLKEAKNKIEGEVSCGYQYHFYMETQVALSIPTDDGIQVTSSTQWMTAMQQAISQVLNIDRNRILVPSQYVGGGFGGKLAPSAYVACASALAAHITYKPVYVQMDLDTCMRTIGFRNPILAKYEVGFDDDGTLQAVKVEYYVDTGCNANHCVAIAALIVGTTSNVYKIPNLLYTPYVCITNVGNHNAVRAPGTLNGIFVIETILDQIATKLGIDPLEIRRKNIIKDVEYSLPMELTQKTQTFTYKFGDLFEKLVKSAEVTARKSEIEKFNKENKWRKKGISVIPIKFDVHYSEFGMVFSSLVTIYSAGGSVVVAHGGAEIGQGINSKIAQVCAYTLEVPLDLVSVKLASNPVIGNSMATGGATTSELVCHATRLACKELKERIDKVKAGMPKAEWAEIIDKCVMTGVNLTAQAYVGPANYPGGYTAYGAACTDAEVDVLTGHIQLNRADLIFDAGDSLSPLIDIGQVEGCYVMGLGYYLTEELRFDPVTGANLVFSTGEYFPPTSKDIPVDFRVTLLKDAPNPTGVLSSKATGEPPLLLSASAFLAVKSAIAAAREEQGDKNWFRLNAPATPEHILLACKLDSKSFTLKEKGQSTQL